MVNNGQWPRFSEGVPVRRRQRPVFASIVAATLLTTFLTFLVHARTAVAATQPSSAPSGVQAIAVDSNAVLVRWSASAQADWYAVYRDGAKLVSTWQAIDFVDRSLAHSSAHTYSVRACTQAGCSPSSTAVRVTTLPSCSGVRLAPSQNVVAAITAKPAGTTFCFAPGTYRLADKITPRSRDVLWGAPGAILAGGGVRLKAIGGAGGFQSGVTVRGLTVQGFTGPGSVTLGNGWLVEHNIIRDNSGIGLQVQDGAIVRGNIIQSNGQFGLAGTGTNSVTVDGNEIAHNNTNGLAVQNAGGTKLLKSTNALFRGNRVYDNNGNGLHCDTDCRYVTFVGNVVTDNFGVGIFYEKGWDALIRRNVVIGNDARALAMGQTLFYGSNVHLNDSQGVEIVGNLVKATVPGTNGIGMYDRDRGSGPYGTYKIVNDYVHDNTVFVQPPGQSGVVGNAHHPTSAASNVRFVHNTYRVADVGGRYFAWAVYPIPWKSWRDAGNDRTGTYLRW